MHQPLGFIDKQHLTNVCQLHKAIYGLKQSPRKWFATLSSFLHQMGFIQSQADHLLLILQNQDIIVYLVVYVDDLLLTRNQPDKVL